MAFNTKEHEIELPLSLSLQPTILTQDPVGIIELEEEQVVALDTAGHEFELALSSPTVLTQDPVDLAKKEHAVAFNTNKHEFEL